MIEAKNGMPWFGVFFSILSTISCGGSDRGAGSGAPNGTADRTSPLACAEVVLRPAVDGVEHAYERTTGAAASTTVDLSRVAGVTKTTVSVQPCQGGSLAASADVVGSAAFSVDPTLLAKVSSAPCYRVAARSFRDDLVLGTSSAVVRQGDATVTGNVSFLPTDGAPSPGRVRVTARFASDLRSTDANADGSFAFAHAPAGPLLWVRAEARSSPAAPPWRGEALPMVTLGNSTSQVDVKVELRPSQPSLDAFEPDDSLGDVAARPPYALGVTQTRSFSTYRDVDVVPVAAPAGVNVRVAVRVLSPRADVSVRVTDATSGDLITSANEKASDFRLNPMVSFSRPASGTVNVTLRRNDQEPGQVDYTFTFGTDAAL